MATPLAVIRAQRRHRIVDLDFSAGYAACCCGVTVEVKADPAFDRAEALAEAWLGHRRDVGMRRPLALGYDREDFA